MTAVEVLSKMQAKENTDYIDEIVSKAAKEFQEEMDFSILADMFKQDGWVEVKFSPVRHFAEGFAIKHWLAINCKGNQMSRGSRWLFEKESDAVNFILKWNP